MYVLKIKGNGKISNHIQIRDDNFTLIAYFKAGNHSIALKKCGLIQYENEFLSLINKIPFGIIKTFKI